MLPDSFTGFPGDESFCEAMQQNEDCYGTVLEPFHVSAIWSSSNTSVMSLNPGGWAQAEAPGTATVSAFWRAFIYTDGGSSGCESGLLHPFVETLCNVLGLEVTFLDAKLLTTNKTAQFVVNRATLDILTTTGANACDGERFAVEVTFDLPDKSQSCCGFGGTSNVLLGSNNKFEFAPRLNDPENTQYEFFGNESQPSVVMYLRRRPDRSGSRSAVTINVGGTFQNGQSYSGGAILTLRCP